VDAIDLTAQPNMYVEVEVQHEAGLEGRYKLYVHVDGITVLRISKMTKKHLRVLVPALFVLNDPINKPELVCTDCRCGHKESEHNEDGICNDAECPCYHFTAGFLERTR